MTWAGEVFLPFDGWVRTTFLQAPGQG